MATIASSVLDFSMRLLLGTVVSEYATSIDGSDTKSLDGGSKILRSISEFLHFGASLRVRRQSVPLSFNSRSGATSSETP